MTNCDQFRELIEAYALGALDAEESVQFESHLATGCASCATKVEEARQVVSQLAYLAPDRVPSPAVKERLMQTVRAEAPIPLQSKRAPRNPAAWTWIGLAALVLLTVYSVRNIQQLRQQVRQAQNRTVEMQQDSQKLQEQLELTRREMTILTDSASVKIALVSADKQTPQMDAMWHSQMGIVVTGQHVPMPTGTRVLQLWLIPKGAGAKPMPSLTLRPDADGKFMLPVFDPPKPMAETAALAITEEPAGGSPEPTTTPRWVGGLH